MRHATTPLRGVPPRPAIIDAGRYAGRIQFLSLAAIMLAALVAGLAVLIDRGDAPAAPAPAAAAFIILPDGPAAETGLRVQVALPGLGAGAPASVASMAAAQGSETATPSGGAGVALTAARYARHLAADLGPAAEAAVIAPETADAVQVAVAIATEPALLFRLPAAEGEIEALSDTALAVRLGLGAQEDLPPFFTYEVERGDSLEKIARRFGISAQSIIFNNFAIGDGSLLAPGASLTIPTRDGVVYNVRLGDTLYAVIENFAADLDATLAFPGNNLSSPSQIVEGATILLVGGSASVAAGAVGFSDEPVSAIPDFRWPLGGVLTDFFGSPRNNHLGFHTGVDFSAPTGTFVGAAAAGVVTQAGWEGTFGLLVTVDHGGGVLTRYAHLDHIDVWVGEAVAPGDLIGFVGNTGLSSGPHLHFEIIMGGTFVDPLIWLNS